jgi:DNA-binding NtrC family response regulator
MSSSADATRTRPFSSDEVDRFEQEQTHPRHVLLLVYHRDGVEAVPLLPGAGVVVGRTSPADVCIADESLSRQHARFLLADGGAGVEDLGSTNGTQIAGRQVTRGAISVGDEVRMGAVTAAIHVLTGAEVPPLGLDGHDAFRAALEAELSRARFFGRPLALLALRALERQGERGVAWYPRVRELVRPVDRVALYGAGVVEVLLAETGREQALALARKLTDPESMGLRLGCGVACFPGAASADELIEAGLEAGRRATAAQAVQVAASEGHRTLSASHDAEGGDGTVMQSPAMRDVARTAAKLASAVIPVLIHGETGTGKEVLARLIHEGGPRRSRPLVAVNCGAIPAELLESILFGHEKGAFTGAGQKKGLFEAANGGTILLDEIGELPAAAQVALLRVLEEKRVRPVGAVEEIEVDVRVLAATHRDLEAMVAAGGFRSDLLYRLNAMEVTLPPLRERRQDIASLATRFVHAAAKANSRAVRAIAPDAMALLERYAWPGNVRELRNAVERAVVVAEGETIAPLDLPARVRSSGAAPAAPAAPAEPATSRYTGSHKNRMESFERDTLLEALRESGDNQTQAARLLDMPVRTLQHKLHRFGIKRTIDHGSGDKGEPEEKGE